MNTNTIQGNLITLAQQGQFHAIAHGANCYHTMGAGIARTISQTWPQALQADKLQSQKGDPSKLGTSSAASATNDKGDPFLIFNLYTQFHWGNPTPTGIDSVENRLTAIGQAFSNIAAILEQRKNLLTNGNPLQLGIPLIGAGLAGGNWNQILPAIQSALAPLPGTLTIIHFVP